MLVSQIGVFKLKLRVAKSSTAVRNKVCETTYIKVNIIKEALIKEHQVFQFFVVGKRE